MRLQNLGYAVTIQRAQGLTVDTAHVLVASPAMTREALYVALTRGREANIAYVAVDEAHLEEHQQRPDPADAIAVLAGILHHSGAELAAHGTLAAEQDRWTSVAQIAAEYETIATESGRDRWIRLLVDSGIPEGRLEDILASDSLGPLFAELRRAEANRVDLAAALPAIVAQRPLDDAEDIGAVLLHRLSSTSLPHGKGAPRLIVGLVPEAVPPGDEPTRRALAERADLIRERARSLAQTAIAAQEPWTTALGPVPAEPAHAEAWLRLATTVAAYRDRHQISGSVTLGPETPEDWPCTRDRDLARRATLRAVQLSQSYEDRSRSTESPTFDTPAPGL